MEATPSQVPAPHLHGDPITTEMAGGGPTTAASGSGDFASMAAAAAAAWGLEGSLVDWLSGGGGGLLRIWAAVRAAAVVPAVAAAAGACLAMSVMLLVEAVWMAAVSLLRRRPERRYWWGPLPGDAEEGGRLAYPMVLVQIPMYNEREKLSIGAACGLSWPSDRIIVQVLDDSTDPTVKMSSVESSTAGDYVKSMQPSADKWG